MLCCFQAPNCLILGSNLQKICLRLNVPPQQLLQSLRGDACQPKNTFKKKYEKWGKKIWFSGEGGGMVSKQNIHPCMNMKTKGRKLNCYLGKSWNIKTRTLENLQILKWIRKNSKFQKFPNLYLMVRENIQVDILPNY